MKFWRESSRQRSLLLLILNYGLLCGPVLAHDTFDQKQSEQQSLSESFKRLYGALWKRRSSGWRAPRPGFEPGVELEFLNDQSVVGGLPRDINVVGDLFVGGDTFLNNLDVSGTTTLNNLEITGSLSGGFGSSLELQEQPGGSACIKFDQSDDTEKARICTSPIMDDKGLFISVDEGVTQNFRVKNDGDVNIAGNLFVDGSFTPTNVTVANALTVNGPTIMQALQVLGTATFADNINFTQGVPGIFQNELRVTKGTLHGPNEFNSINAALASIATNSATNQFTIKVGSGVFEEDTIVMKPYVSIVGESPYTTVIKVNDPGKDVVVGAPNAVLRFVYVEGATDPGKAAIVYHGGGYFRVTDCIFGVNDIILNQDATVPFISATLIGSCEIIGESNFTTAIKSVANGPIPVFIKCDDFTWVSFANPNLDAFIDLSGIACYLVASDITCGAFTTLGNGTGMRLADRANVSLNASVFSGFDVGFDMPNVGLGPSIIFSSVYARNNVIDLDVQNPLTTGIISCVFARDKTIITEMSTETVGLRLFFTDTVTGTLTVGPQYVGDRIDTVTNINPQIQQSASLGVTRGGMMNLVGGLDVEVEAGSGYLMVGAYPDDHLKYVEWETQTITLPANQDSFIYIDEDGIAQNALSTPSLFRDILLGKAWATATGILYCQNIWQDAVHTATQLDDSWRRGLGPIYASGSLVSKNGTLQLDVSSGQYFFGTHEYKPSGGSAINWEAFYRNGSGGFNIVSQSTVDFDHYDDSSGTLASLPANNFARHSLYVVNDGSQEEYLFVYGQEVYASLLDAQNGVIPTAPSSWDGNVTLIASLIVENTAITADRIAEIRDERPTLGFKASGVSAASDHGNLTGLLDDDHPQYLLTNGTRAMTGDLNMGSQNIANVGTVDGVDVSAHAARHVPNGADPLPTALPVTIGTSNAVGIQNSFARSDHIHAHGSQSGGTLHAVATTGDSGFMSAADKTKLDGITTSDFVLKTGSTMTGPLAINTAVAGALQINTDKFVIDGVSGDTLIAGSATVESLGAGVVHSDASGLLSSSLVVDADIDGSSDVAVGAAAANDATNLGLANRIVKRDGSGDFSAGTITANLIGNATTSTTTTNFSGVLSGDVTGTQGSTVVAAVSGESAANVATGSAAANAATNANIANRIVKRDGSGNFSAGTITANLSGNATTATTATNLSGSFAGDVTGTQNATVVSEVGGQSAANVATGSALANAATHANTASALVKRDGSGNFSAGTITANLSGNAATATTATNFSGSLAGDVTGTQNATVVSEVGGQSAANVAAGSVLANAATSANTASALVKRDGSGNFSAGTITANVTGSSSLNVLKSGDTMTGSLTLSGGSSNLSVGGTTTTTGLLDVDGSVHYALGVPGIALNELVVTKGTLHGPNEFNSIKAAVDSITTNSIMNPFVVRVGAGVYVEDTIQLKPFISLVAESVNGVILKPDSPSKDILIGATNSLVQGFTLEGATDPGKAAVVFSGGPGGLFIKDCLFGSSNILVNQTSVAPLNSACVIDQCGIKLTAQFEVGFKAVNSGVYPLVMRVSDLVWLSVGNPILDTVVDVQGTNTRFIASNIEIGTLGLLPGDGIRLQDGAFCNVKTATLAGFVTAIDVPNVGAGPTLNFSSTYVRFNTEDLRIDHPSASGVIEGIFDRTRLFINPSAAISLTATDPTNNGSIVVGPQYVGDVIEELTNISPQIQHGADLGVVSGGTLSVGAGLSVGVAAGTGYLKVGTAPDDYLKYIEWNSQNITLPANQDSFVYIDNTGTLQSSLSVPSIFSTILIGKARTTGGSVLYLQGIGIEGRHTSTQLDDSWRRGLGNIYASGSLVSKNGTVQLDVSSGQYFFGTHEYLPSGGTAISWEAFYRNGSGGLTVINQSSVDFDHYDDDSGTLATIPVNEFARHALYVVGDGSVEKYLLVYGQTTYASLLDAQSGVIPAEPGSWGGNIALIASIIVENSATPGNRITEIRDERPTLAFKASGVSAASDHGNLTGLGDDDHLQYLLVNGTRAMSGNLDMGTNNITNVGTVDGVDVSAHAARHLPNGADPITTGVPVAIGSSNSTGVQNSFARSDHVHAHGDLAGGSLHAVATTGAAGFMSASDKTKLDGIDTSGFVQKTGDTMTGTLNITAGGANALVVNTNKFVVDSTTGNSIIAGTLDVTGATTLSNLGTGVVHANGSGLLSSSLITNADVAAAAGIVDTKLAQITTAGKVANSATTATSANTVNAIVARDGSGNFSAGTITANLSGTATNFSGSLAGDVSGTQGATVVDSVGGQTAANIASGVVAANDATNLNTANKIVKRDGSGNFSAGTITANLTGNATTATTATNFSGSLSGDVTGTQSATVVSAVGGETAANVASGAQGANGAVATNTPNKLVKRDGSGNFSAGTITANLSGNATTATTATNFSGSLSGDVTGTQGATVVSAVGGETAANVASGAQAANTATNLNTANRIVKRDGSGNFSAGTISANLSGNVTGNVTGSASNNVLKAGDTMTGNLVMDNQKQIQLRELTANGTNNVSIQAPASLVSDYTLTLPPDDGVLNQVLRTDGNGVLSWITISTGDTVVNNGNSFAAPMTIGTNDNFSLDLETNGMDRIQIANSGTITLPGLASAGVVHTNGSGDLSTSLIVNVDIAAGAGIVDTKLAQITTANKVANSATTATSANTANTIVARDGSGNFNAGTITASLTGSASNNVLKAGDTMTGNLVMDNQKQVRFRETTGNGVNYVALQAPASLGSDYSLTLPVNAGTNNQALITNGSGVLSWGSPSTVNNDYIVSVYLGSDYNVPSDGTHKIPFNIENIDDNNNFNTSTNTYTAPVTGVYFVAANISVDTSSESQKRVQIVKNGSPVTGYSNWIKETDVSTNLVGLIKLNAGDTLRIDYTGLSGEDILANDTSLHIYLVTL